MKIQIQKYVNQRKLEKVEAKQKQKLEKKEKGETGASATANLLKYDSAALASTSQALVSRGTVKKNYKKKIIKIIKRVHKI